MKTNKIFFAFSIVILLFIVSNSLFSKPNKKVNNYKKEQDKALNYIQNQEFDKAFKVFSDVLKKDPKAISILISRAELNILLGKLNDAIDDYNKVINIDSLNSFAYYRRAVAKNQGDSIDYAVGDYTKAISLDSSNTELLYDWAVYDLAYDNIYRAINTFKVVLEREPNRFDIYGFIGFAYYKVEEYEKSLENYNIAIDKIKDNKHFYFNRANANLRLDKLDEAINDYTQAIILDSTFEDPIINRIFAYYKLENQEKIEEDERLLQRVKEKKMKLYDDNIDIEKCKMYSDSSGQLKIYLPDSFYQNSFSDSEIISIGVTREDIKDILQGFVVGVIAEKIIDPSKTLKISNPEDLVNYLKSYAVSTGENAIYSNLVTEKQKPLTKYGPGVFFQSITQRIKYNQRSEEITQHVVGFIKYNTLILYRFIFPSVLAVKYDKMVENAIDRFEF